MVKLKGLMVKGHRNVIRVGIIKNNCYCCVEKYQALCALTNKEITN